MTDADKVLALTYHYKFDGTPSEITLDLYYN